jgi:putative ABC transport system substrate-binding protein
MSGKILWCLLNAALLALSAPAEAKQPKKVPRVGYLAAVSASADAPRLEAFRQGLRDLGYVGDQSQNGRADRRYDTAIRAEVSGQGDSVISRRAASLGRSA